MRNKIQRLKTKKGSYGYISYAKKKSVAQTILFFVLSFAIYALGYFSTGTNKNLLTIVAVLGLLPSCKSAVNMIMFLKASGCSAAAHEAIAPFDDSLYGFYDLYFTSYQKNFPISHLVLCGNVICAYTEKEKCDCAAGEKHLQEMLTQEGIKSVSVKIFNRLDKYVDRLGQLSETGHEAHPRHDDIVKLLLAITL